VFTVDFRSYSSWGLGILLRIQPAIRSEEALHVLGRVWQRPVLAFAELRVCGQGRKNSDIEVTSFRR